jgi:hypothetical protein
MDIRKNGSAHTVTTIGNTVRVAKIAIARQISGRKTKIALQIIGKTNLPLAIA